MNTIGKIILLSVMFFSGSLYAGQSHCKNNEKILLNCSIKNSEKILSLCGNGAELSYGMGDITPEIQYRFGKLNNPELIFPKKMEGSTKYFKQYLSRSGWMGMSYYEVFFSIANNKYTLFRDESNTKYSEINKNADIEDGNVEDGFQQVISGVRVKTSAGKSIGFLCDRQKDNYVYNLDELFLVLEEVD